MKRWNSCQGSAVVRVFKTLAPTLLCFSFASLSHAAQYVKDASQFCLTKLSAEDQSKYYSRILTIGASFSHGCTECDKRPRYRGYNALSDDSYWIRRSPFLHFLASASWKNKNEFNFEYIATIENDPRSRPTWSIPDWQIQRDGYEGLWVYDYAQDHVSLMDAQTQAEVRNSGRFFEEARLVGGVNRKINRDPVSENLAGTLYQTVPGKFEKDGAKPKYIFDFSVDGARMEDLFLYFGDRELFARLDKTGWIDLTLREAIVHAATRRMQSVQPTLVFALDSFFWDSFARALNIMENQKPNSKILWLALKILGPRLGKSTWNAVHRKNLTEDFLEVLRRVSVGHGGAKPVPVLLARTTEQLETYVKEHAAEVGSILGKFLRGYTGEEITTDLIKWFRTPYFGVEIGQSLLTTDPVGGGGLDGFSDLQTRVSRSALLSALTDLPLFVHALGIALREATAQVRALTSQTNNNVHMVNADSFYHDFPAFLKPESMHPTVYGSKRMGRLMDEGVCASQGGER